MDDILEDFVEDYAQFSTENLASILQEVIKELEGIELNSHARLACYTMNKTGVASGSFS